MLIRSDIGNQLEISTSLEALHAEYQKRGFIRSSFALGNPGACQVLLKNAEFFDTLENEYAISERGHVPYTITNTIRNIANDRQIVKVINCLLDGERWVMWGSNVRKGTPNKAHGWHVDLESWLWPTITVVVGIKSCTRASATWCVPYSHLRQKTPVAFLKNELKKSNYEKAEQFTDFGSGRFYVFNARCCHRGDIAPSIHRRVLFLHYQRASDPRIPLMLDYERHLWSSNPAPYISGDSPGWVNQKVYGLPLKYRLGRVFCSLRKRLR